MKPAVFTGGFFLGGVVGEGEVYDKPLVKILGIFTYSGLRVQNAVVYLICASIPILIERDAHYPADLPGPEGSELITPIVHLLAPLHEKTI